MGEGNSDRAADSGKMNGAKRTRYSVMVDSVLGTIIGALVLGFFAIVWTVSMNLTDAQESTNDSIEDIRLKQAASNEVFSEEIAKLRTGIRRLESMIFEMHNAVDPNMELPVIEKVETEILSKETISDPSALKIRRDVQQSIIDRVKERK